MSQTMDRSPGFSLSDNFEDLLWRSLVFSTIFYLVRAESIKQVKDMFFQVKKTDQRVLSKSVCPWYLRRESLKGQQKGRYFILT